MIKPFAILFAAPPSSSTTAIAYFLSHNLNLPIISNNSIRREVIADNEGLFDNKQYLKRREIRLNQLLENRFCFILDGSVDRTFEEVEKRLKEAGYEYFLISIDFSRELQQKIINISVDRDNLKHTRWYQEHQDFLKKHGNKANLHIKDVDFPNRMELSLKAVREFIKP